jgi:predicted transcriptional regulator YdeE
MKIEIINKELKLDISGFSGVAANKNYAGTAFALMDKMWPVVKSKGLKHKGLNIWVYETDEKVFAGVELEDHSIPDTGLEQKTVLLTKYAYYKHIGPYSQLKQAGDNMQNELRSMGLKSSLPYIEIYGHWTNDESKLETELLMAID